ncbi:MAG: gas vesicle protein GvpN [Chloroherpetonaceae bacterium]|nr:gas vesicle protein GvpN [Chloroherpetonaceae bacterium]MDW8438175.1 gas vesicle protein GvpN [Chloroherpetonaceae bacterium]
MDDARTVIEAKPMADFVETPYVRDITYRALTYIEAGFPVHFRGASGTGKTTLAMHVASKIGRPIVMLHGDSEYKTSDLVGGEYGFHSRKVVDRFQSRVLKVEEDVAKRWVDNRLTVACKYGFTLIYDEFTRSRPEANNVLLSVLQEKVLDVANAPAGEESYLKVHPLFTALFTSNPEEYAGVHKAADALRDRMVTIDLDYFDYETEVAITVAKSKLSERDAAEIVDIVRALRESGRCEFAPTIRACIMIARALQVQRSKGTPIPNFFMTICQDVLTSETSRLGARTNQDEVRQIVKKLVERTRIYHDELRGVSNAKHGAESLQKNLTLIRQQVNGR